MSTDGSALSPISKPSRVAGPDEGIGADELGLAARNHGMPLEALRYDVTPLGLHYLLIHYDIPCLDESSWRLSVRGLVDRPLELSLAEVRRRPAVAATVTLECAGNGRAKMRPRPVSQPWLDEAVGTMRWTGTPLRHLLEEAGVDSRAVEVVFTGADHGVERGVEQDYARSLPVDEAMRDDVLLAYEANGVALLPQHGFPLRLVVPGWYGMAHVKWLSSIELVDRAFDGFQMRAYRLRESADDVGAPLSRMEPRALVSPPGWPDFMTRARFARPGRITVEGRAWSGWGPVDSVEVSFDGGRSWHRADLAAPTEPWAWRRWSIEWAATEGRHLLSARASDATGRSQAGGSVWNRGGFAGSTGQQVEVLVTA
jgi:DMSO/TMAO reductase YedYZ molybdopterin-dependent catalytic subunit